VPIRNPLRPPRGASVPARVLDELGHRGGRRFLVIAWVRVRVRVMVRFRVRVRVRARVRVKVRVRVRVRMRVRVRAIAAGVDSWSSPGLGFG
jgi:hypothetical protein